MDDATYRYWWQLHLRVARGETLNPAEQAEYEAGLEVLDQEEKGQVKPESVTALRRLRARVEQLRRVHAELLAKSVRLDEQIIALERGYRALTGYELASEPYASSRV
jgi:hypothetical protein